MMTMVKKVDIKDSSRIIMIMLVASVHMYKQQMYRIWRVIYIKNL